MALEPTGYWMTNLPATTPTADLVRFAKMRWCIEHDYRELKHGLGLDHFEGRTWRGWHHHVTLVTAAQAFLTLRRYDPRARTKACPSTESSTRYWTCCGAGAAPAPPAADPSPEPEPSEALLSSRGSPAEVSEGVRLTVLDRSAQHPDLAVGDQAAGELEERSVKPN